MEWIALNKEKPPRGQWILALAKAHNKSYKVMGGGIFLVRLLAESDDYDPKDWMRPYYMDDKAVITHWMQLPEWPEE